MLTQRSNRMILPVYSKGYIIFEVAVHWASGYLYEASIYPVGSIDVGRLRRSPLHPGISEIRDPVDSDMPGSGVKIFIIPVVDIDFAG